MDEGGSEMTLDDAIEQVKAIGQEGHEFEPCEFEDYFMDDVAIAIANILNAVVKGELK